MPRPFSLIENAPHFGGDSTRVVRLANRLANRDATGTGRHGRVDRLPIHSPDDESR